MGDNSTLLPPLFQDSGNNNNISGPPPDDGNSLHGIVLLSLLFSTIFFIGIAGNVLVIAVIVRDSKMRQSVTNLMIINLAIADLVVMLLAVPEMVMFMMGGPWLLGPVACRANRFIMTSGLYSSVLSLLALCVER
ncbi:neuropeptide Y receptor type 1 [Elysia marginata]|uniref:Neuropeptide Y receptor type 1 n=1 Tax=Elysia marginata TaxID=1093978 RepID=A0AAV4HFU9_9GAST|nr:neuropeptide Y receptor type 1 [Elysia marginata]